MQDMSHRGDQDAHRLLVEKVRRVIPSRSKIHVVVPPEVVAVVPHVAEVVLRPGVVPGEGVEPPVGGQMGWMVFISFHKSCKTFFT